MSTTGIQFGELSYGSLYVGPLGFGYIMATPNNALFQFLSELRLFPIEPTLAFGLLTITSLIGAIHTHGLLRSIFGKEGPSENPKQTSVVTRHMFAIVLNVKPDKLPVPLFRIANMSIFKKAISYIILKSQIKDYESSNVDSDNNREIPDVEAKEAAIKRFESVIAGFTEILEQISYSTGIRILYFLPMMFHKQLTILSYSSLVGMVYLGHRSYIGYLLIFSLTILLFRRLLWAHFPSPINVDQRNDTHLAEYEPQENERSSRINTE